MTFIVIFIAFFVMTLVFEIEAHIFMQCALISFQANHVIAKLPYYLFANLALSAHGIYCHYAISKIQKFKKLWNSRDFVAFSIDFFLSQDQLISLAPSAHNMKRFIFTAIANSFTIDT